ncbi:MAG TPA: SRPBCC family protein [Pseudonocardiaceae bacterium]|jgi:uncharacterized protein YndB with AHSA1/START domain
MISVSRDVAVGPEDVFAILADGWSYAGWVVGNSHVRDVDLGWPQVGTRIHHSAGLWPVQFQDTTKVVSVEPNRFLELDARLWLFGAATIRFTLRPGRTGSGTEVVMEEQAVRGPGSLIPASVQAAVLRPRNAESLVRLADLAIGRRAHLSHNDERTNR